MEIAPLLIAAVLHAGDTTVASDLSDAEIVARGEAAFEEGVRHRESETAQSHFREAAACFNELCRRGIHSVALYRNLGQSYLLAGDLPHAVLAYRRGLQIAPDDHELTIGLQAARARVWYTENSSLGRPRVIEQPFWSSGAAGKWIVIGAELLYVLACVGLTSWLITRRRLLLAATLLAFVGAGSLTTLIIQTPDDTPPPGPLAVIAEDGVLLRRGDGLSYPPRYETLLYRGVEGRLLAVRGNWMQIELSGGEAGWVLRKSVLVEDDNESQSVLLKHSEKEPSGS